MKFGGSNPAVGTLKRFRIAKVYVSGEIRSEEWQISSHHYTALYCKPARLTTNVITEHRHLLFTDAHLAGFTVGLTHLYAPVTGTDRPIYTYY